MFSFQLYFWVLAVWVVGLMAVRELKKIDPDDKAYPVYALVVCVLFTIVAIFI